jgi:MFS transporter, DHA1 family, inner membrane transport protein
MSKFTFAGVTRSNSSLMPLLALSAATFTTVSAEMMPSGVLNSLSSSFSVSEATAGLVVTAWAGTVALTSIPLVRATLRWRRRSVVLATLGLMAVANLATALAPSYAAALTARVVAAAGHGLFWAVVVSYAASLVSPDRVGRALSIVLAGPTLASLVGLPVGTAVAHHLGWRVTFAALAVACAICLTVVAAAVPVIGTGAHHTGAERWDRSAKPVLLVAGGGFFALVGFYAVFTFIVPVSGAIAGIGAGAMPGVLLASGIGGLIGVLAAGRISDRWPDAALPITALAMAASLAAMGWSRSSTAYVAVVIGWGALIGVLPVALQANVMRAASEQFRNTAGSILVTVLNLGIGAGAALGSFIAASASLTALPFIAAATTTLAIAPLAALRSHPSAQAWRRG